MISETGLSRATIYRKMDNGTFPKNRAMRSTRARVWIADEVREWKADELVIEDGIGDLL